MPISLFATPKGAHCATCTSPTSARFDTSYLSGPLQAGKSGMVPIANVVNTSINMCDIDIRAVSAMGGRPSEHVQAMYGGVLVAGGNSLTTGFVERLNNDLLRRCPSTCKLRLTAPPTTAERRFGAWVGGSIMASLVSAVCTVFVVGNKFLNSSCLLPIDGAQFHCTVISRDHSNKCG